ncbi:MAG: hypothetical protein U0795_13990 [Pirellulales bacterium]
MNADRIGEHQPSVSDAVAGRKIRWAAQLDHVREVTLLGLADHEWWQNQLKGDGLQLDGLQLDGQQRGGWYAERLVPVDVQGHAQLMIVAAEGRFNGVRFRELSLSVMVQAPQWSAWPDAAYLWRAYNSNRFFAFCERFFFATPYEHGAVDLSVTAPVAMGLREGGKTTWSAEMGTNGMKTGVGGAVREPVQSGRESWEGLIFLPGARAGKAPGSSLFVGKLSGDTQSYTFDTSLDRMVIDPTAAGLSQAMRESRFVPTEWNIREDAWHAKSKTYATSQFVS